MFAGCKKNDQINQNRSQEVNQIEEKNMITSIKDAMGLNQKMKCVYRHGLSDEFGESVAYIQGKKYKSSLMADGQKINSFFDGQTSYTWTEGQKNGTKMAADCMKEIAEKYKNNNQDLTQQYKYKSGEDFFDNAINAKCEPTDEDISLPTDVTFEDQCEQMKTQLQMVEEMMKKAGNMNLNPDMISNSPNL